MALVAHQLAHYWRISKCATSPRTYSKNALVAHFRSVAVSGAQVAHFLLQAQVPAAPYWRNVP